MIIFLKKGNISLMPVKRIGWATSEAGGPGKKRLLLLGNKVTVRGMKNSCGGTKRGLERI